MATTKRQEPPHWSDSGELDFADKGRVFDNVGLIREDFGPKIANTATSPFPLNLVFDGISGFQD